MSKNIASNYAVPKARPRKKLFLNNAAFTLAEVLITLGIIGVVAAITIPILMNATQDIEYKSSYKKAYSNASQAWLATYADGELTPCSNWDDGTCNKTNFTAFKNHLKLNHDCENDAASCWNMTGEKLFGASRPTADALAFTDSSGEAWVKMDNSATAGAEVLVDTNGFKKPNQFGKDRFLFNLFFGVDAATSLDIQAPKVGVYYDCTGVVPADYPAATQAQQLSRCPSYATHPCFYKTWITGSD